MTVAHDDGASLDRQPDPGVAALACIHRHFPTCAVALLSGSVGRSEGRPASDLDVVVLSAGEQPRWATFTEAGWPIEVFVHTLESYLPAFGRDVQRRWPFFLVLCAEGRVLIDRDGRARAVQDEARRLLAAGPAPLSREEIDACRHYLTVALDDFADADDLDEARFIGHDLATKAATYYLTSHRHWRGLGKWLLRAVREADPAGAQELLHALAVLYQEGNKAPLHLFAQTVLSSLGGRRFEGYTETW